MNLFTITVILCLAFGWIGLVLLDAYRRRNRRPISERPSRRVIPQRPSRQHRNWWQRVVCGRLGLHWYPRVRGVAGPLTDVSCVVCGRPRRDGRPHSASSRWGRRPYYWGGIGWGAMAAGVTQVRTAEATTSAAAGAAATSPAVATAVAGPVATAVAGAATERATKPHPHAHEVAHGTSRKHPRSDGTAPSGGEANTLVSAQHRGQERTAENGAKTTHDPAAPRHEPGHQARPQPESADIAAEAAHWPW
jgi:hypothetical protein